MYSISDEAKQILNSRFRENIKARVTMHDGTIFSNEVIESIDWNDGIIMDDHFEIGTATMAQITIKIMLKDNALGYAFEGKELFAEIGVTLNNGNIEYIPLGYFTVEKAPHDNDYDVTLTCSDRMYKLEAPYVTAVTYPATLLQIAQDIANEADVELANTSFINSDYIVTTKPTLKSDLTCRKAIMAVAELAGGYAHINRAGKLEIINANADINNEIKYAGDNSNVRSDGWLIYDELITGNATITRDNYSDLKSKEQPINKIDGIVIGTLNKGICDYPLAINKDNIFLQDPSKVIDNLYNALNGFSYQPFTMTWQGNPAVDCGDKITILGRNGARLNTIATSRTMSFNGGLSEEYTSVGKTANEQDSTPVGDTSITIADTKDDLQQYTDNAVSKLAGNKGGYIYLRRNDDGTPSEIFIMDSPSPTTAKSCLRINKEGIGGSINGINGPFNFSCLIDGSINATMVTTGTMIADRIKGGTLTLGGLNNINGSLIMVDANGNQIGSWDNTGLHVSMGTIEGVEIKTIDNGNTAMDISGHDIHFYDWIQTGNDVGFIGTTRDDDAEGNPTGTPNVEMACEYGNKIAIGYKRYESNGYSTALELDNTQQETSLHLMSRTGHGVAIYENRTEYYHDLDMKTYKILNANFYNIKLNTDDYTAYVELGCNSMGMTIGGQNTYSGTVTINGMAMTFNNGLLTSAHQV